MQSMTGFGYATSQDFRVEIKSLNHRFMEINTRMPSGLSQEEPVFREIIKSNFKRGRFDITVNFIEPAKSLKINSSLLKRFMEELSPIGVQFPILINMRDLTLDEVSYNRDELYRCFNDAVSLLKEMRLKEGSLLHDMLRRGIDNIKEFNAKIKSLYPLYLDEAKKKILNKVFDLLKEARGFVGMDLTGLCRHEKADDIVKEIGYLFERIDIEEEVSRIDSHIEQFMIAINSQESQGKRLDFITQELLREVNTIASKAINSEVVRLVIDMKVEIERLKEQVQNIE